MGCGGVKLPQVSELQPQAPPKNGYMLSDGTTAGNVMLNMRNWQSTYIKDKPQTMVPLNNGDGSVVMNIMSPVNKENWQSNWMGASTWKWAKVEPHVTVIQDANGVPCALIVPEKSPGDTKLAKCSTPGADVREVLYISRPMFDNQKGMEREGVTFYPWARVVGSEAFPFLSRYYLHWAARGDGFEPNASIEWNNKGRKANNPTNTAEKGVVLDFRTKSVISIVDCPKSNGVETNIYTVAPGGDFCMAVLLHIAVQKARVDMEGKAEENTP